MPEFGSAFDLVINRAMDKTPRCRPASAGEFAAELLAAAEQLPAPRRRAGKGAAVTRSFLIALAVVLVAVVGALVLRPGEREPEGAAARDGPPANAVRITFAYSPENSDCSRRSSSASTRAASARRPAVRGRPGDRLGRGADADRHGQAAPSCGRPPSSLWGRLLNFEVDRQIAPRRNRRSCARRW